MFYYQHVQRPPQTSHCTHVMASILCQADFSISPVTFCLDSEPETINAAVEEPDLEAGEEPAQVVEPALPVLLPAPEAVEAEVPDQGAAGVHSAAGLMRSGQQVAVA